VLQVHLTLTPKSARLTWTKGDSVIEDEVWKFETPAPKSELRDIAECVFHDCYDLMNHSTHGAA